LHLIVKEQELIARAQQGEKDAFQDLMAPYQRKIYSLLYGMVWDREDALELTQEVFIKAYRSIKGFRMASSFYTWLYRIAVNLAFDFRRRRIANPETHRAVDPPDTKGPDATLLRKELNERIQMTVAQLPPRHRAALLLREVEGLTYKEIAQIMGCRLGTVMSRLHYAREGMRRALTPYLKEKE
jgi:RNA polymerase sigma-70 factor (ECF subfamily)